MKQEEVVFGMIEEPYTIFTRIPLYRDVNGRYATDPLWQWDLEKHFDYISNLRLCCPVVQVREHSNKLVLISGVSDQNVAPMRLDHGWLSVIRNLVPNGIAIFQSLSRTEVAHSGGAGWPFPESYYMLLFRPFLRFKWIILIESSFYRMPEYGKPTIRQILGHHLHSFLVKCCVRSADARIFTTKKYQELFLNHADRSLIAPVVWMRRSDMRPVADHRARALQGRQRSRLIFPTRLVRDKGVQTVLDAVEICAERCKRTGVPLPQIEIIGAGPMLDACRQAAAMYPELLTGIHEPLPYGEQFTEFLRGYDALIVASLQENGQPRILYDALSQGLPCIASETKATREAVKQRRTGVFFEPGNPESLADLLIEFAAKPDRLFEMGAEALRMAAEHTHETMHETREKFLVETLGLLAASSFPEDPRRLHERKQGVSDDRTSNYAE